MDFSCSLEIYRRERSGRRVSPFRGFFCAARCEGRRSVIERAPADSAWGALDDRCGERWNAEASPVIN
jgi:hypothetical protein